MSPVRQRCEAFLQRNSWGFLMVTAAPDGKIPKRKSQITNKFKITNSNTKTESKIGGATEATHSKSKGRTYTGVLFRI